MRNVNLTSDYSTPTKTYKPYQMKGNPSSHDLDKYGTNPLGQDQDEDVKRPTNERISVIVTKVNCLIQQE